MRNEDLHEIEENFLKNHSGDISKSKTQITKNVRDSKRSTFPRTEILAKPKKAHLLHLCQSGSALSQTRLRKIRTQLKQNFSLTPKERIEYSQHLNHMKKQKRKKQNTLIRSKVNYLQKQELDKRREWLLHFANEISDRLADYVIKQKRQKLVPDKLNQISDTVLERVSDILGEPKPSRRNPGKLPRFMIAVSDRIAVWISTVLKLSEQNQSVDDLTELIN